MDSHGHSTVSNFCKVTMTISRSIHHPRALNTDKICHTRTADVAANSPRFRRKSSTFVDAIHDLPDREELAPAQLYSTESGRLFHSGRIAIITVGLPARGKTYVRRFRFALDWLTCASRQSHICCPGEIPQMVCLNHCPQIIFFKDDSQLMK